ncbi:MAG: TonB-dependent receptor [Candidatus Omnitrophica bacterium]|nr:TonB-dependent receptor [Candidatus Omnitrophota bacterium]
MWLALAASLVAWSPGAQAEEARASKRLPGVLVTASRSPEGALDVREFPGNATVVTAEAITRSGASSVPELLNRFEGLSMMDTHGFGLGADAGVNIRGVVNSSRTGALVLVNGVRQNRPTGDEVHWQSIPLEQIERIEIIRGGGGLAYGEGALSGVINIVTKKGAEEPLVTETGAEAGSFGRQRYFTAARGSAGPVSYGTSFTRRLVSGYRESTNSRTSTTTAHLGAQPLEGLAIETNVLHSEDTSYFSGGVTPAQTEARRRQIGSFPGFFDDATMQASVEARVTGPAGLSGALSAFWHDRESDSVTSFGRFATIAPSKGLSLRVGHEAQGAHLRHGLVGAMDLLDEKSSVGLRGARLDESNKGDIGLFVEETLRFFDRLTVMAGLRFDKARFEEDISFPSFLGTLRFEGLSPKLGASVDLVEGLTAYASFARPFKAPEVDDFSAVVPTTFVGNLNLQPQQADDYELGLRGAHPGLGAFTAAVFFNRIDDEILFNANVFQNQNMDTERTGLELVLEPRLPLERLDTRLAYTFIEAEFRKGEFKGRAIPGVPEHRFTASLIYELVPGFFATADWLLVQDGFRINDFNNTLPADNYGVLNLGVRLVYGNLTVYFTVENATNEEYTTFQSSNGVIVSTGENPAPPTSFIAGLTLRF